MSPRVISLLLVALACAPVLADELYKSVDSAGNVTYSSTPPKGVKVEKVELLPPPTEAEVQTAEERLKRNQAQANELEAQRREKEAAQAAQEEEEARQRATQQPVVIEVPTDDPQPIYYPPTGEGFPPGMPTGRPIPIEPRPRPR
jgi:TolA-binding protein